MRLPLDVVLALAFLPAAWAVLAAIDRHARGRAARHPRPASDGRGLPAVSLPAPASSRLRLVGAGQPWPANVDGYLAVLDGCWATKLTDSDRLVRCGVTPTNVDGLCQSHQLTLQQVRDEHARTDREVPA